MSPAGTYGGWLTADPLDVDQVLALTTWLQGSRERLWWRVNPFDPAAAALGSCAAEEDVTHVLRFEDGHESAFRQASRNHRRAVRKARELGVRVRPAQDASDWEAYDRIYRQALERWGGRATSNYGARLFDLLRRQGAPCVELSLVTQDDGTVIAGGLCLYGPRHVFRWHGVSLKEHFRLYPANLLVHELSLNACNRSMDWFDLNPDGGHAGVRDVKERVGAIAPPSPVIKYGAGRPGVVERVVRRASKQPGGAGRARIVALCS
jgi:hypothetical protein